MKRVLMLALGAVLATATLASAHATDTPQTKKEQPGVETGSAPQAPAAAPAWGPGFVDANGNGICDRFEARGSRRGAGWGVAFGPRFGQTAAASGPGFVDANANGICDRFEAQGRPAGPGWARGRGGRPGRTGTWGPGFVDANGNGICDRYEARTGR